MGLSVGREQEAGGEIRDIQFRITASRGSWMQGGEETLRCIPEIFSGA